MSIGSKISKTIVSVLLLNGFAWGCNAIHKDKEFKKVSNEMCPNSPRTCTLVGATNNALQSTTGFVNAVLIKGFGWVSGLAQWGTNIITEDPQAKSPNKPAVEPTKKQGFWSNLSS